MPLLQRIHQSKRLKFFADAKVAHSDWYGRLALLRTLKVRTFSASLLGRLSGRPGDASLASLLDILTTTSAGVRMQ